jgi:hypothetical protein
VGRIGRNKLGYAANDANVDEVLLMTFICRRHRYQHQLVLYHTIW